MPQLANDILDTYGSPVKLYVALQKDGDSPLKTPAGDGGLGKHFNRDLTREAFVIDSIGIKVSLKARNIEKLWELCKKFKHGDRSPGQSFSKNANKHIICLAFLVKQETTSIAVANIQEQAYAELLNYYQTVTEYQDLLLHPTTQSGTKVVTRILELQKKFEKRTQELLEQKTSAFESQNHYLPSQQTNTRAASYPQSALRPSLSENSLSALRHPSQIPVSPHTLVTIQEEEKETLNEARVAVHNFLNKMVRQVTPRDGEQFSLGDIKIVLKIFFIVNVPDLTLLQLRILSSMMNAIQSFPNHEEKRFDEVRRETNFFRRHIVNIFGNTTTWEIMATKVQQVMLRKLTKQEFQNKYPDDKLEDFDFSRIVDTIHKIPLEPNEFRNYHTLFKSPFNRWPNHTPEVLDLFANRFIAGTPRHGGKW